jgi:SAM-dependent methyltransferase
MEVPYLHDAKIHNSMAPREVVPLVMDIVRPKSVVDVGCGLGTWLTVFEENGIKEITGVDGEYVDRSQLHISSDNFIAADLVQPFRLPKKFDLVISLEVAEHLPESAAETFVQTLTSLGDTVLFSAAVPGQGGQNHLNEQWPEYWNDKFEQYGFCFFDIIRDKIWYNDRVDFWYRQNIFLVSSRKLVEKYQPTILSRVHPDLLKLKVSQLDLIKRLQQRIEDFEQGIVGVQTGFDIFKKAVQRKMK